MVVIGHDGYRGAHAACHARQTDDDTGAGDDDDDDDDAGGGGGVTTTSIHLVREPDLDPDRRGWWGWWGRRALEGIEDDS